MAPIVAEQEPRGLLALQVVVVPIVAEQELQGLLALQVVAVPTVVEVEQKSGPKHYHNCSRLAFQDCSERRTSDKSCCFESGYRS